MKLEKRAKSLDRRLSAAEGSSPWGEESEGGGSCEDVVGSDSDAAEVAEAMEEEESED